jgi:uncharacterized protein
MERLCGLIIKMSERCNLNCLYCYMYNHVDKTYLDRPTFMSDEIFEHVVSRIAEYLAEIPTPRLKLVFHGGEPMLMSAREFGRRLDVARRRLGDQVMFVIQTNGTLVTPEWVRTLKHHDVSVGISIDGTPAVHNALRIFHDGRGSYARVAEGIGRLVEASINLMALCVVAPGDDGRAAYRHIRSTGLKAMDFLLPEESHDYHVQRQTTPVADYLIPAFDEWIADDDPTIRVRLFESIIRVINGGTATVETIGRGPYRYLVVDTDGSIHGNDVMKVCESDLSNTGLNVREHAFGDVEHRAPRAWRLYADGLPIASACTSCPEVSVCGGGPAPMRYSRLRGFDNPSVWCADLLKLITHIRGAVMRDAAVEESGGSSWPRPASDVTSQERGFDAVI